MEPRQKTIESRKFHKLMVILGAVLIFLPERFSVVWGNMLVYVTSYFYALNGNISVTSDWILTSVIIGSVVGPCLVVFLKNAGRKKLLFCTILFTCLPIVSMRAMLKHGYTSLICVAFGILGICSGMTNVIIFKIIAEISGSSKGKYLSIVSSALNFGPVFTNFIVGFYMNPENLPPTLVVDHMQFFSEDELVAKVPTLLTVLGISFFLCMMTGYAFLFWSLPSLLGEGRQTTSAGISSKRGDYQRINEVPEEDREKSTEIEMSYLNSEKVNVEQSTALLSVTSNNTTEDEDNCREDSDGDDITEERDFTTLEALKNISFHTLGFSFGIAAFPQVLLFGSYKTYGLVYIKDDNLLTVLGMLHPLVGGIGRIAWGFVLHSYSIKACITSLYAFISLTVMLMYFAPFVNIYLYFFATLLAAVGIDAVFPTFLLVVSTYFGEKHFVRTFAMIRAFRVLCALIISPLFEELRGRFGWFGPFSCVSSLSMISFLLMIFIIPDIPKEKK